MRPGAPSAPSAPSAGQLANYNELSTLVHLARTLLPTDVIAAMAATTIRPAIRAYSSTSPPCSSRTSFASTFFIAFMTNLLLRLVRQAIDSASSSGLPPPPRQRERGAPRPGAAGTRVRD